MEKKKQIWDALLHILIVGLGCSKKYELGVPISLGLEADLVFKAGNVKKVPKRITYHGYEWIYRIFQSLRRLTKQYFVDDIKIFILAKNIKVMLLGGYILNKTFLYLPSIEYPEVAI